MPVTVVKKTLYDSLINGDWISSSNGMNKYAWYYSEQEIYYAIHTDVNLGTNIFEADSYVFGSYAGKSMVPLGGGVFGEDGIFTRTPFYMVQVGNSISNFGNSVENFRDAVVSTVTPYAKDNVFWVKANGPMPALPDGSYIGGYHDFYMMCLYFPKVSTAERPIMRYNGGV